MKKDKRERKYIHETGEKGLRVKEVATPSDIHQIILIEVHGKKTGVLEKRNIEHSEGQAHPSTKVKIRVRLRDCSPSEM